MSRFLRFAGWCALLAARVTLIFILALGFILLSPPDFIRDHLAKLIAQRISSETPPHVAIEALHLDLAHGAVILDGLSIGASPSTPPAVRIARVRVDLDIGWDGGLRVAPREIVIQRPQIQWSKEVAFVIARLGGAEGEAPALPRVHIIDGEVEGTFPQIGWVSLSAIRIDAVPTAAPGELLLRGRLKAPSSGGFRFEGRVTPARGSFDLGLAADELWPDPRDLPGLSSQATRFARRHDLGGKVDLRLAARGIIGEMPTLRGMIRFRDLHFLFGEAAVSFDHGQGHILLDERSGAQFKVRGEVRGNEVAICGFAEDVASGDPRVQASLYTPRAALYAPWIHDICKEVHGPWEEFEAFQVGGRASITVRILRERGEQLPRAAGEIDILGATGSFVGYAGDDVAFPYRLRDLDGRISFRPGEVLIPRLEGRSPAGPALIEGAVWIGAGLGIDLSFDLERARIDEEFDRAVRAVPRAGKIWSQFQASGGMLALHFRIHKDPREDEVATEGKIILHEARTIYRGFPLPARDLEGTIDITPAGSHFAVRGRPDDQDASGSFAIEGLVGHRPATSSEGTDGAAIHIKAQDLTLNAAMRGALKAAAPEAAQALKAIRYGGHFDLEGSVVRPAGAPAEDLETHLALTLRGGQIEHMGTPVRLDESHGRLHLDLDCYTERLTPRASTFPLHGWALGAALAGASDGAAAQSPETFARSLLVIDGSRNEHGMQTALEIEALEADAREVAGVLGALLDQPFLNEMSIGAGTVDIGMQILDRPMQPIEAMGRFYLHGVHMDLPGLPAPIEDLTGSVALAPQHRMSAPRLTAEISNASGDGRAKLSLENVRYNATDRGFEIETSAHITDLSLDENISFFLGARTTRDLMAMKLGGQADLQVEEINLSFPLTREADGEESHIGNPHITFRGSADVRTCDFDPGFSIGDFNGKVQIRSGDVSQDGKATIVAQISNGSMKILDLPLEAMRAKVELHGSKLSVENLTGRLFGGPISGIGPRFFELSMGGEDRFELNLRADHTRLEGCLKAVLGSAASTSGEMDAAISLHGSPHDLRRMNGTGRVEIRDGNLGSIPVLNHLNPFLSADAAIFRHAKARFHAEGFIITIDKLALESDAIELVGRGAIGLDGSLLLSIDITYLEILPIPLLGGLIARGLGMLLAANPIIHIEIRGRLDAPRIVPKLGPGGKAGRLELIPRAYFPPRIAPDVGIDGPP